MPYAEKGDRKKRTFKAQGFLHPEVIKAHHDHTAQTCCRDSQIHILNGCPSFEINVACSPQAVGLLLRETINGHFPLGDDDDDGWGVFQPLFIT